MAKPNVDGKELRNTCFVDEVVKRKELIPGVGSYQKAEKGLDMLSTNVLKKHTFLCHLNDSNSLHLEDGKFSIIQVGGY